MTDHEQSLNTDADSHGLSVPSDISAGALFCSRYQILESLGQGGMGSVYKAVDISLNRTIAIKLLRYSGTNREIQRFHLEAKVIAQLDHRNIVKVYEVSITDDDRPYLVMDYVEGHTLADEIKEGALPLDRTLELLRQACDAIGHAHGKGIVHRDLKPSNLMITAAGDGSELVKLLDFGLAKLRDESGETVEQLTRTGEMFGTPQYMSPEQIACERVDERSDIYSLGCVFYEMVSGIPPFRGQNAIETCLLHRKADPVPIWKVSNDIPQAEQLHAIISKMLAKAPKARFQNISELTAALTGLERKDNSLFKHWKRFILSLQADRTRLRYLTGAALLLVISLAVLCWYGFSTVTDGVMLSNMGPELFSTPRSELRYAGQEAFDKGNYQYARKMFDEALVKARLDFSDKRHHYLLLSLHDLDTLCDVANMKKPVCVQAFVAPENQTADQVSGFRKSTRRSGKPTRKSVSNLISKLSELVAIRGFNDKLNLPEIIQVARAQLNQLQPVPKLEEVKLNIIELMNMRETENFSFEHQVRLAKNLDALDEIANSDAHLANDWRWSVIAADVAFRSKERIDAVTRIDRLERASKSCPSPVQRLRCDLVLARLISVYEGELQERTFFEKAVHRFERSDEFANQALGYACFSLGDMYMRAKQPTKSVPLFLRARRLMEGVSVVSLQEVEWKLALNYCDLGRLNEALNLAEYALDSLKRSEKEDSVLVANAMNMIAFIHVKRGEFQKAEHYMLDSMEILAKHPEHPFAASFCAHTMGNLASLYYKIGDAKSASMWMQRLAEMKKKAANSEIHIVAPSQRPVLKI